MRDSDVVKAKERITPIIEELLMQTERIEKDCKRIKGVLDGLYYVENIYELEHILKSIIGRQTMFTRFIRQWIAIAERLEAYVLE